MRSSLMCVGGWSIKWVAITPFIYTPVDSVGEAFVAACEENTGGFGGV